MSVIAIVGSGPKTYLPDLTEYKSEVDVWIGADLGGIAILEQGIQLDYAVGDFDSVTKVQKEKIFKCAHHVATYPEMKNETDLELALLQAYEIKPEKIYLFGITGGRLDHTLINVQLLHTIVNNNIRGLIVDRWNKLELKAPGKYTVLKNERYPYISFVPFTEEVKNISLVGFVYPIINYDVTMASTRLISNQIELATASISFEAGLLLLIQSRDNLEKNKE